MLEKFRCTSIDFFFSFEKLPTNQIERHCVQSALQLRIAENKPDATGSMQWE